MEIYIVRHTKVKNTQGICYGQSDVEIEDTFNEEVDELRMKLPTTFDKVYASPSKRCKTLAEQFNLGKVEISELLLEMNFGDWEGKNWNDINQEELNAWMIDFVNVKATNGENLIELYDRLTKFLNELSKQSDERVLIVTHAGIIRCIWAFTLGSPLNNIFKLDVGFGSVYKLKCNSSSSFSISL
jgi:alpha-ribazole phosphatase